MAKKKPKGDEESNSPSSYTVYVRIDPALGEAFDAEIKTMRPKPSARAVVEMLIEEWLKSRKAWPPKEGGS